MDSTFYRQELNLENTYEQQAIPFGMNRSVYQETIFDLPFKYSPIKFIGSGAFGTVISVKNLQTNKKAAVKCLSTINNLVSMSLFYSNIE